MAWKSLDITFKVGKDTLKKLRLFRTLCSINAYIKLKELHISEIDAEIMALVRELRPLEMFLSRVNLGNLSILPDSIQKITINDCVNGEYSETRSFQEVCIKNCG
jgi:hypothetical protein